MPKIGFGSVIKSASGDLAFTGFATGFKHGGMYPVGLPLCMLESHMCCAPTIGLALADE